jgi:hypothetical protein
MLTARVETNAGQNGLVGSLDYGQECLSTKHNDLWIQHVWSENELANNKTAPIAVS